MRNLIAAFLAFFALSASATDMVARSGADVIRLEERACVHAGTLAEIQPQWREHFHMARAILNGHDWYACWILTPDGNVHIVYEDGDESEIPLAVFKQDDGV